MTTISKLEQSDIDAVLLLRKTLNAAWEARDIAHNTAIATGDALEAYKAKLCADRGVDKDKCHYADITDDGVHLVIRI